MNEHQQNCQEREISNYQDFLSIVRGRQLSSQDWVFRGQSVAEWGLSPLLERAIDTKKALLGDVAVNPDSEERELITQFKKRAFHYVSNTPADDDDLEWLALMQHHGAPTRLLDWTKSPYVGLFFALAEAKPKEPAALWAVNTLALEQDANQKQPHDREAQKTWFKTGFFRNRDTPPRQSFILPVSPFRMNPRLAIQQGVFLCANAFDQPFQARLEELMRQISARCRGPLGLIKFKINPQERADMLRELGRMNISYETLLPGIDGFAKSLVTRVAVSLPVHYSDLPACGN